MPNITCPLCGKSFTEKASVAKARCPKCGKQFRNPTHSEPAKRTPPADRNLQVSWAVEEALSDFRIDWNRKGLPSSTTMLDGMRLAGSDLEKVEDAIRLSLCNDSRLQDITVLVEPKRISISAQLTDYGRIDAYENRMAEQHAQERANRSKRLSNKLITLLQLAAFLGAALLAAMLASELSLLS